MSNEAEDEGIEETEEELESARTYLRQLLKYRPRTEQEVRKRLEEKDYSLDAIDETINWAVQADLIDDRLFAEYFIEDRLENKPKGRSGLYRELLEHGVDGDLANEVLDEKISPEEEERRCRELARKRLSRYSGDDLRAKYRKTLGFLQRRGFPKGLAGSVLKEMLFNDE
ncbi:regulatory protein RecX [Candidatus Bipolaricaulota bacterium]|nr:regulatory protein RecX [Candidatus Bipolaricaulota bacterium]